MPLSQAKCCQVTLWELVQRALKQRSVLFGAPVAPHWWNFHQWHHPHRASNLKLYRSKGYTGYTFAEVPSGAHSKRAVKCWTLDNCLHWNSLYIRVLQATSELPCTCGGQKSPCGPVKELIPSRTQTFSTPSVWPWAIVMHLVANGLPVHIHTQSQSYFL